MSTSPKPPPPSDTDPDSNPLEMSDNEELFTMVTITPSDEEDGEGLGMDDLSISTTHNDQIVARIDELVNTTMAAKKPSEGVPELLYMMSCPMHKPDLGLGKGVFRIPVKGIGKMSLNQLLALAEGLVRDAEVGCGFEGCIMTLEDAIYESCDEEIICFRCEDKSLVDPEEACKMHDDTTHMNLVIVALAQTASWYADKGRKAMIKGKALLYTDAFGAQIFPCVITQALQLHNYVKSMSQNVLGDLVSDPPAGQFSKMVNLLTDHLKDAGPAVAKSEQVNKTKADVKISCSLT